MGKASKRPPSPGPSAAALRRKVACVAEILEGVYGRPRWTGGGSVLDSLVGCILSQNTNDRNSARAWQNLKKRFPSWEQAAAAPAGEIEEAIRGGGLAPSKSARIKAILDDLKRTRGGYDLEFLRDLRDEEAYEYLTAIHGVGWKTAAVVLLFAAGRDVFPVDTHIHRIAQRLGLAPEGTTRDGVFEAMRGLVPPGKAFSLHVNLIRFGRDRCTKRNPRHEGCPLRRGCLYVRGLVSY